jgi:formylglycine-generating enzyme required for sulfatase activity
MIRSLEEMAAFAAETPGAPVWLAGLLPPEAAAVLSASAWYRKDPAEAGGPSALDASAPGASVPAIPAGSALEAGGLRFREIPAGALIRQTALPRRAVLDRFWIAAAEVSGAAWEAFLEDNAEWRPENLPALRERGLVNSDYLVPQDNPAYPAPARSGVSWYAATAYCVWLTGRLPPSLAAGYEVRLPTEAEWEYAASTGPDGGGMSGGLWEWCVEPFSPLPFLPGEEDLIRRISSPERPVKGGSWISVPGSVGIETRASLPPSSCSPFVGFRPVIARRGTP